MEFNLGDNCIGTKVECFMCGKGVIINEGTDWIIVQFDYELQVRYKKTGHYFEGPSRRRILTLGSWEVNETLYPYKKGDIVWTTVGISKEWVLRHYSHYDDKGHNLFMQGKKDGKTFVSKKIKLFDGKNPYDDKH